MRGLAAELARLGLRVWFDEWTLRLGDSLRRKIDEGLRASSFGVVVLSPGFFTKSWPQAELDALFAIAEECGYSEWGGSVSMVNWSFAVFRQHHPLPVWAELADWIIVHTTNPYIPFNFQRTRGQWKACREGSPSPEETWRRVGEAEARRQRERTERMERESGEARERAVQREATRRKNREEHQERSSTRSLERLGVCSELERLPPLQRLERICTYKSYPLEFYPTEFAAVDDTTIAAMSQTLRAALLERLKDRRKGAWHKLRLRLQAGSPAKS